MTAGSVPGKRQVSEVNELSDEPPKPVLDDDEYIASEDPYLRFEETVSGYQVMLEQTYVIKAENSHGGRVEVLRHPIPRVDSMPAHLIREAEERAPQFYDEEALDSLVAAAETARPAPRLRLPEDMDRNELMATVAEYVSVFTDDA